MNLDCKAIAFRSKHFKMKKLKQIGMYSQITSNKIRSFALIFFFIFFICLVVYVYGEATGGDGFYLLPFAVGITSVSSFFGYFYSDKIVLGISKAKELKHDDNPKLYHIVENLCIAAGMQTPKIYIIDDTAPNAFATGRKPAKAVIAMTTGLIQKLNKTELEGVIAHELSHIKNYDILIMTLVVVFAGIVALLSDWFLRWSIYGKRGSDRGSGQLKVIMVVLGLVLALLAPLIGTLIKLAISRKREYLADASGALLTRYPEGLAAALEKIAADTEPLEAVNKATAHLYIVNPLKGEFVSRLFSTHPPIAERVRILRGMIG